MPALPEPPPTLRDPRVALRLAADRDIPEVLIAHQDDPGLAAALGEPRPPSGAQLGRRVEQSAQERSTGRRLWLTITEAAADECRGQLEVSGIDADRGCADLTVWIGPSDRGRGLGAAALALAGRWLLTEAGLARVQLLAAPENLALWAAAERAGYRREGVLRGYLLTAGGRVDMEVGALVTADLGEPETDTDTGADA